jgi:ABC-type glycerol-3-phosphate transport system substrate-binding protein
VKRWKLAVAAAAAAALLAAGCSSGSSGGTAASPVTITIWHNYGTEQNATALNNLAKAFEKLHSNIKVTVVSQPASNYFAQLQAAAISRNGPDLGVMWTGLFTLQYKSFLKNLKGQVSAADLARIDPNALKWTSDSFNAANGPYVIPLENQFYIGFYNKSDFAKAGVTSVPTNWNQLYAACTKLKNAGYTPIVYGNGGQPLGATFYPWYDLSYMMIGAYSVQQWQGLYSGQIPWTSPAVAAQLANWTKLHSSGCTNKDVVTNTNNLGQFESGKAAMMVDGTWDTQKFTSALGSKVAAFAPPFSDTPIIRCRTRSSSRT